MRAFSAAKFLRRRANHRQSDSHAQLLGVLCHYPPPDTSRPVGLLDPRQNAPGEDAGAAARVSAADGYTLTQAR